MIDEPLSRRRRIGWLLVPVVATLAAIAITLAFNPRFYFVDDSQSAAFGQWFEIGRRLLGGDWSLLNPTVWQSGNYLVETSWGLYSPIIWMVGLGSHLAGDVLVYVTLVKVIFLVAGSIGCHLLARSFGANPLWSAMAATVAPLCGATVYLDSASWANGLMGWALLPFAWAANRAVVVRGRAPIVAILACAAVISISYVHSTLVLIFVIAATLVEAVTHRDTGRILRGGVIAVSAAAMVTIVHLPALLTAPVTGRSHGVFNSGVLTVNLSGIASSATPTGTSQVGLFGVAFPDAPLTYIAWVLPLFAFVDFTRFGRILADRFSIVIALAIVVAIAIGPSDIGPLRFPIRMMPFVAMCVLVVLAVGLSLARKEHARRGRLFAALGVVFGSGLFALFQGPQYKWKIAFDSIGIALVICVIFLLLYRQEALDRWMQSLSVRVTSRARRGAGQPRVLSFHRHSTVTIVSLIIATTLGVTVVQHQTSPASPLRDYGLPTQVTDYTRQLAGARGETFIAGTPSGSANEWKQTLVGNAWYLPDKSVQNAYSAVYFPPYAATTCMVYNGSTCGEVFGRLFTKQPTTGDLLVDLLGIDSVQLVKASASVADLALIPNGWHIASDTIVARLIVRDRLLAHPTGIAWRSAGVETSDERVTAQSISFHVDSAGADGGTVAFRRIPWTGYATSYGSIATSWTEGMLLTVDLPANAVGKTVVVSFEPPGYGLSTVALLVLIVVSILSTVFFPLHGRRLAALRSLSRRQRSRKLD